MSMKRDDLRRWDSSILVVFALLLPSLGVSGEGDCDCTVYPFQPDPPCFDICAGKYLQYPSTDSLENMLDVDAELINQIKTEIPQGSIRLSSFEGRLKKDEFIKIKEGMKKLGEGEFKKLLEDAKSMGVTVEEFRVRSVDESELNEAEQWEVNDGDENLEDRLNDEEKLRRLKEKDRTSID